MKTAAIALAAILATTGASFADQFGGLNTYLTYPTQTEKAGAPALDAKRFVDPTVTNSTVKVKRLPAKVVSEPASPSDRK